MYALLLSICGALLAVMALCWALRDHFLYRKRLRELQRRTLETQRNLRHLGNLANEVAHEIKNPITAILCSAETLDLLIGPELDPQHRKSLQYIKEYGDNLLRLVSDFLDLSRVEAGKIEARAESVRLRPIVDSIIGLLESNAMKKQIRVSSEVEAEDLAVTADPKHVKQVLFNLVHNAIKFTPENGEIVVSVTQEFPGESITVSVKDNGVGIPAEEIKTLFNPYTKGESHPLSKELGAGLGLALCKNLIELNGGSVSVESERGQGSTFTFHLPCIKEQWEERLKGDISRALERREPLFGQRFLVVDEDTGSRESLSRLIEAWGGVVDRVSMAIDAVEALEQSSYDAVVIDDTLDGVYGHELARMIRQDLKVLDTTIVVATDGTSNEQLARESGADSCVEKPLNGKTLLASLLKSGKYSMTH
ncbi:MAG: response regulator [Bdellovibrionales bacterium]|nr:response regulator [Bdellovibrionales bacterium]